MRLMRAAAMLDKLQHHDKKYLQKIDGHEMLLKYHKILLPKFQEVDWKEVHDKIIKNDIPKIIRSTDKLLKKYANVSFVIKNRSVHPDIVKNMDKIILLCKKHNIESLSVFGSSVTGNFNPKTSDFDFIIHKNKNNSRKQMREELELLLNRKVDLVCYENQTNPITKKSINETKITIV